MPDVRRRRRGRAAADAGLRDPRDGRHGRLDERPDHRLPAHAHGDAPLGAPERLARRSSKRAPEPRRGARRHHPARPPRREARRVRRPQPAHGLRPRRLHPLQPLRPLHAGGHAVLGTEPRGQRRRRAHRPHVGALLARYGVRALRRLPFGVPDRRDLREVRRGDVTPGTHARAGENDLHLLRRRLPDRPQPRSADEAHREGDLEGRVPPERGQPLREGPLRVQLRAPSRPAVTAPRPRRGRRAPRDAPGSTRWIQRRPG